MAVRLNMRLLFFLLLLALVGCKQSGKAPDQVTINPDALFVRLPSDQTGIAFVNQLTISEDFDVFRYRNYYNGGGVAIGDINNDGLSDVYLTSNMGDNKLFLNKGNWKFEDITNAAGVAGTKVWSTGVSFADVNADGLLDIYVCNSGDIKGNNRENELFINNGDLTFTEKAKEMGLADNGFSTHAAFFDYDNDGDLDCYVLNNSFRPISTLGYRNLRDRRDETGGDKLYTNRDGYFYDVSESAGIYGSVIGFGLGVTVGDVNQDNWLDIYISNDFYERDYLYINNKDGTFSEKLTAHMGHISMFSMGADLADINNDGFPDIFSTDMLPQNYYRLKTLSDFESYDVYQLRLKNGYYHQFMRNMLQLNNQDGTFSEVGQLAGVDATDWSWGALIADFNNDTNKEIFVCNGIYKDVTDQDFVNFLGDNENMKKAMEGKKVDFQEFVNKMTSTKLKNYMFVNNGNLQFENKSEEWGLGEPGFSNGAAYGDLDNDGDADLIVNNVNQDLFVYRNNSRERNGNSSVSISFKGKGKNTFGIGAKVKAYFNGQISYFENIPTRGFQSCMDYKSILGIGTSKKIDSVEVIWPLGTRQMIRGIDAQTNLVFAESSAAERYFESKKPMISLLTEVQLDSIVHKENQYNDFDQDRLLYHMLSTQGPGVAVGDLNHDGLDDLFVGGAKGKAGAIYLQEKKSFRRMQNDFLQADSLCEDVAAVFFDADGDRDLDLYVVSGGNEQAPQSVELLDRLYENKGLKNGKPNFERTKGKLPALYQSGSCVKPQDVDNDGDIDLFVGTRLRLRYYGLPCDQFLLLNDGKGNFKDVSRDWAPAFEQLGMVTDAAWFNYDDDEFKDLIVVGDWMPITVFKNNGKKFEKVDTARGLENTNGWWNRISMSDIDHDGDADFVLGNLGLNSRFKPTPKSPISLYVNDFDQNGSIEPIYAFKGKDGIQYPFALRQDLIKQMSSLKKKFVYAKDYATQSLNDFLDPKLLADATVLHFYEPHSSVLINHAKKGFVIKHLPLPAQFSPVNGIALEDVDNDKELDIILGGNLFSVKPEEGRYDAMRGLVLLGDGKFNFTPLTSTESGVKIEGEVRQIEVLSANGFRLYSFIRNNSSIKFYKLK